MILKLNIADDTLGFSFEKKIDQKGVDELKSTIEDRLKHHKKINLYIEEDDVDEIEMGAIFEHVLYEMSHSNRIRKVAIVSDRKWIRGIAKLKDLLIETDVQAFESKDRVDALCWVTKLSKVLPSPDDEK